MEKGVLETIKAAALLLEEARKEIEAVKGFTLHWNVEIGYCTMVTMHFPEDVSSNSPVPLVPEQLQ